MRRIAHPDEMKIPVMWYCIDMLPTLRRMDRATVQAIANEASAISGENAVHHVHTKEYIVPSWSPAKLTGLQIVALMLMALWVLCGESEEIAHPLMDSWPMREILALVGPKPVDAEKVTA